MRVVDFFCGAGGMTHGLMRAGHRVLGGIDIDLDCKKSYEHNNPGARFLHGDITGLTCADLTAEFGLRREDDELIFVGCSPCQFWSKINTDRSRSEKTAYLLREFQRFVEACLPGFVVIENVPGLEKKRDQSALPEFLAMLDRENYRYDHKVINANRYGVPQNRKRYLLIASRTAAVVTIPHGRKNDLLIVRRFIGPENGFRCIPAGHVDTTTRMHTSAGLTPQNLRRIRLTPHNGGNRMSWKDNGNLQIAAYAGDDKIFRDVYGRMVWEKPAPTITTRFNSLSNGRFGHPEEDRAISLREGATLQTFPRSYRFFAANQASIARQIGNAVPPALAERIGRHLLRLHTRG